MPATFTIRPATVADADGIREVHVQGWREAYRGIVPDDFIAEWGVRVTAERWRRTIESETRVTVALDAAQRIVGWSTAGAARHEDAPWPLELQGLYILREAYGTGVGRRLLEAGVGEHDGAYLWVFEANARARAFYTRCGFTPDGVRKTFDLDDGRAVPEMRMVRPPS